MKQSNNTPKLRFAQFNEDWECQKLGEVVQRVRGNDGRMDLPTLTMSASSGWLNQIDRFSSNIAGNEQKNYTLLKKGQLSYNHGNSKLAKYGVVFELTSYDEALVPKVYHSFETNKKAVANFLEYMFATKLPDRELRKLVSSGARMDGLLNISYDDFMGIKITIPNVKEQTTIGNFFRQIDKFIALHQGQLDKVKTLKKGLLQKMFPAQGETAPQIRFPQFTDDWEIRKLGEVGETFAGLSGKTKDDFGHGDARYITYLNVFKNSIADLSEVETVEIDKKQAQVKYGDVLFTTSSETPQEVGMSSVWLGKANNTYLNSFCFGYRPIIEFNPYYLSSVLRSPSVRQNIILLAQGISRYNISKKKMMEIEIPIPTLAEQTTIGNFFHQFDDLISLHQRKLEHLKGLKKSLLQQMFV